MVKKIDISTPKFPNTYAFVDDEDYETICGIKWCAYETSRGRVYVAMRGKHRGKPMHRYLLGTDEKTDVLHINGNGLDNRRCNFKTIPRGAGATNIPIDPVKEKTILTMSGYGDKARVIDISTKQHPETYTFVDTEDYEWLISGGRWHVNISGRMKYLTAARMTRNEDGKRRIEKIARVIMGNPNGKVVDHINGNPLDNRRCNLRICSQSENSKNQALRKTTEKPYKGVKYRPEVNQGKPYQVSIAVDREQIHLGYFGTADAAADAYDKAALKYHGEFARTNAMIRAEREKKEAT